MIVAIQPDHYGPTDTSFAIWTRVLEAAGHEVRLVNVNRADILDQLQGCQGFMWRHGHYPQMRLVAQRLLPVIERELNLVVYPDQKTCWHYDDKLAQAYLLPAAGVPTPRTWVWFDREEALQWLQTAVYPLVLKLWAGAGSTNVCLAESFAEAVSWIERLFGNGVVSLEKQRVSMAERLRKAVRIIACGHEILPWEPHKGYAIFQEFLKGNPFDTRVTVIGNRAFGFRRFNRENDFRASGSGRIDYDPQEIAPEFIRLAFDTARRLKMQSCAIDGLRRGGEPVVGEVSYTYTSWAVQACPGHWDENLEWHEGQLWPEEAQALDYIERLKEHG
jgi:glutathione synthase/RimK-type ligase-like ATP-grasp enzyme